MFCARNHYIESFFGNRKGRIFLLKGEFVACEPDIRWGTEFIYFSWPIVSVAKYVVILFIRSSGMIFAHFDSTCLVNSVTWNLEADTECPPFRLQPYYTR